MHLHIDDTLKTSFDSIYKAIKTDLVDIDFFALLCLAEFDTDKYDVVISSPRLVNDKDGLTYLNDTISRYIKKSDYSQLSKLVILEDSPPSSPPGIVNSIHSSLISPTISPLSWKTTISVIYSSNMPSSISATNRKNVISSYGQKIMGFIAWPNGEAM